MVTGVKKTSESQRAEYQPNKAYFELRWTMEATGRDDRLDLTFRGLGV